MSDKNLPTPGSGDSTPEMAMMIGNALQFLGAQQVEAAKFQAESNKTAGATQVELARINAAQNTLHGNHAFIIQLLGLGLGAVVIGAAFWTQHYELVTHALVAVLGAAAGYGLGRRAR
jgi:hypothetical protein